MEQRIKFPRSQKVYLPGKLYPNIRVAMRKVEQVPSVSFEGEEKIATPNPEVYVYDTSGPFSDTEMNIDLKKGLPRMREEWIVSRGDVERLPEITSEYGRMRRDDKSLDHLRSTLSCQKRRSYYPNGVCEKRNNHSRNGVCSYS